ncbi:methyltransferase [Antrihabitans spumae]|uniref:Methyltransferase n=1 Tax=Antrihabitans spumae TaxID=3373370 RepID=A0ABW7K2G8_9NOCA
MSPSSDDDSAPESSAWYSAWQILATRIDLVTPWAIRAAATLRLADLIADGADGIEELSGRSGTDPDALSRLLRHLVSQGVFVEKQAGRFGINDVAALLLSDHPAGMKAMLDLDGFGGRMDVAFTGLLHTVRTGEPAWETVFGSPFWEYLADNENVASSFDAMMASGDDYILDAVGGYDWSEAAHVVDVGGGTGAFLAEVLQAAPTARGTVVDLPATAARAREFLAMRALEDRCDVVGQSFFDPLPPGGDVYVVRRVVHDWSDVEATAILRRCAEAAGSAGRVVMIESRGIAGDDPAMFAEMNLRMMVLAGGRERSVDDYAALAAAAGLRVDTTRTTPLGHIVFDCTSAS